MLSLKSGMQLLHAGGGVVDSGSHVRPHTVAAAGAPFTSSRASEDFRFLSTWRKRLKWPQMIYSVWRKCTGERSFNGRWNFTVGSLPQTWSPAWSVSLCVCAHVQMRFIRLLTGWFPGCVRGLNFRVKELVYVNMFSWIVCQYPDALFLKMQHVRSL